MWLVFKDVVMGLVKKWIPKKLTNKKELKSKWISNDTVKQMKKRAQLWRDYGCYGEITEAISLI